VVVEAPVDVDHTVDAVAVDAAAADVAAVMTLKSKVLCMRPQTKQQKK
jgi:hypothetical protein